MVSKSIHRQKDSLRYMPKSSGLSTMSILYSMHMWTHTHSHTLTHTLWLLLLFPLTLHTKCMFMYMCIQLKNMVSALFQCRPKSAGGTREFVKGGHRFGWKSIEDMYKRACSYPEWSNYSCPKTEGEPYTAWFLDTVECFTFQSDASMFSGLLCFWFH